MATKKLTFIRSVCIGGGVDHYAGETVDVPEKAAVWLLRDGWAVEAGSVNAPEAATVRDASSPGPDAAESRDPSSAPSGRARGR